MKINSLKDFYLLIVILFSGMAIPFFRSSEGLIALWALGFIIFLKKTNLTDKKLVTAISIWLFYFIINTFIIKSLHPFFLGTYIAKIMIAYWLLNYYKTYIFKKYEDIIYTLSVISLILYSLQVTLPFLMYNLFSTIDLSEGLFSNIPYRSIGIYTFHQKQMLEMFPRNAGFTWEPGPFASYIGLAMFFNIARNGVNFKDRKRLLIFLIALITTQSTTGFLLLLTILIWYAWAHYNNRFFRILSIPITLSLVFFLFTNVPWLQEKILIESQQNIEDIITHAEVTGNSYAPGRFASMKLRWEDFKNYPIAGFGGNISLQYGYIGEDNVVSAINGLGNILGRYGAIGALLFSFLLIKSGKLLAYRFRYSGFFIFPALLLIIGFSFGIIEAPILVIFILSPVFFGNKSIFFKRKYEDTAFN